MADEKGPFLIDLPMESKLLQQLTASSTLRNLSDSCNLLREKETALRTHENSVRVPQLAWWACEGKTKNGIAVLWLIRHLSLLQKPDLSIIS